MRVLVTGASGFIGSHVVRSLLSRGHEVAVLARSADIPWRLLDVWEKIEKKSGKLEDIQSLRTALKEIRPEACIHLAWYAEPGKYLDSPENLKCLKTSLDLFSELIQVGCRQVVGAGTCAEYAKSSSPLKEDSPTGPSTIYAKAKLDLLCSGRKWADEAKVHFAWGRIFYPYGPMEDERRVIPALIRSLLKGEPFPATTGDQVRDYIHVEDAANAFCVLAEERADEVFNISSGQPVTLRQLLERAGKLAGREELIQFGAKIQYAWEPALLAGENQKLKGLGWHPVYSLEKGLQETVQWFKTHPQASNNP